MGEHPLRPYGAPLPEGEARGVRMIEDLQNLALPLGELSVKPTERALGSPFGRAVERSETERV